MVVESALGCSDLGFHGSQLFVETGPFTLLVCLRTYQASLAGCSDDSKVGRVMHVQLGALVHELWVDARESAEGRLEVRVSGSCRPFRQPDPGVEARRGPNA